MARRKSKAVQSKTVPKSKKTSTSKKAVSSVKSSAGAPKGEVNVTLDKSLLRKVIIVIVGLLVTAGTLILIDACVQWYVQTNIVAKIGEEYITRDRLADEMIGRSGSAYIDSSMALSYLVIDKAEAKGISIESITDDDIMEFFGFADGITDADIETYYIEKEQDGESRDQWTKDEVKKILAEKKRDEFYTLLEDTKGVDIVWYEYLVKVEILKEKISDDVTDQEVTDYITTNEITLENSGYDTDEALREAVKEGLKSEKVDQLTTELQAEIDGGNYEVTNYLKEKPQYEFMSTYKSLWEKLKEIF